MMETNNDYFISYQYTLSFNVSTNGGIELMGFDVFVNDLKEDLKSDNKTTVKEYSFDTKHNISVKKIGHEDGNKTDYVITDPTNLINLNMPKKTVSSSSLFHFIYVCVMFYSTKLQSMRLLMEA